MVKYKVRGLTMEKEVIGLAALYAVIEIIKWILERNHHGICRLSPANQKKIDSLYDWHNVTDDEGRRLWYVPKHLHIEQEKIVEMLRDISESREYC
jgi:hypothetical protein